MSEEQDELIRYHEELEKWMDYINKLGKLDEKYEHSIFDFLAIYPTPSELKMLRDNITIYVREHNKRFPDYKI